MIGDVTIENFKSITKLDLSLGRINVLIGENGCGKSNILEAIALCGAAAADRLDHECLAVRGIRVPEDPHLLTPWFDHTDRNHNILISIGQTVEVGNLPASPHTYKCNLFIERVSQFSLQHVSPLDNLAVSTAGRGFIVDGMARNVISGFLIYSPEYEVLRSLTAEGHTLPLGIRGEGLIKLLAILKESQAWETITQEMHLIDSFHDFVPGRRPAFAEPGFLVRDRYLQRNLAAITQRSVGEGFLFLLFHCCLFVDDQTPRFFAIDNVDASLNPKLCTRLIARLTELAKNHDKQVILTTHNPAVLDGLDLDDDEQRLFVVYRNQHGRTTITRVKKPQPLPGHEPVTMSEAFMRGYIGGLPSNF